MLRVLRAKQNLYIFKTEPLYNKEKKIWYGLFPPEMKNINNMNICNYNDKDIKCSEIYGDENKCISNFAISHILQKAKEKELFEFSNNIKIDKSKIIKLYKSYSSIEREKGTEVLLGIFIENLLKFKNDKLNNTKIRQFKLIEQIINNKLIYCSNEKYH